jgi:adenylate cyclase
VSVPVGRTQPTGDPRRRSVSFAIGMLSAAAVVVATAAWLGATRRESSARPATPVAQSSIAVLPFANVSRDERDAAIVDGLAEELMAALYRIPNLRVIARNSAFAFRNSDLDVRRIGDTLRVSSLVEGSVQRSGSRLRVQVRLVDVRDGSTRWAETYEKEIENLFEVQSEIATAVARELNLHLSAGAARKLRRGLTDNIAAHELYLKGRDPERMRSPTDSAPREGIALLKQAVELDSNFAAAYAAMPSMYFSLSGHARTAAQVRELRELAYDAAQKALSLDPSLPEAHIGLGVALSLRSDLAASEAAFRRAIELGGGFRVREHLSRVLMRSGRYEDALTESIRAAEEDPLSASAAANVGEALCANGRYDEGLAQLDRAVTEPPLRRLPGYRLLCYAMQGKWQEARAADEGWRTTGDPWSPLFGYVIARSGDTAQARRMQSEAIDRWRKTGRGAFDIAVIAAGLGEFDRAVEWLDRAGEDLSSTGSIMYPIFKDLHADPRFERYRQRIGLEKR